mmetsp:Transcript_29120/g.74833  ORF Transcript_29120/g.74833 Transcript_29120/m.74833 type:complete len:105 (-) Transcript_29120:3-317(-)
MGEEGGGEGVNTCLARICNGMPWLSPSFALSSLLLPSFSPLSHLTFTTQVGFGWAIFIYVVVTPTHPFPSFPHLVSLLYLTPPHPTPPHRCSAIECTVNSKQSK